MDLWNLKRENETLLEKKSDCAIDDTTPDSTRVPIIWHRSMDSLSSVVVILITMF